MNKIIFIRIISIFVIILGISWCGQQIAKLPAIDENNIHMCLMWWGKNCNMILDPKYKSIYWEEIQKICTMMPMDICKVYFGNELTNTWSIDSLPEVKFSEIVKLNSGDKYNMDIYPVKMKIGNKRVRMLSYNGSIPWPTIQAPQWAIIYIKLTNKTPDLITTLHSHWLRLNDLFDWVPKSMMWKQEPMNYNDSFDYQITFPDAGIFWYHPHIDEQIQQELGLYGNYLSIPASNSRERTSWFDAEHVVVLDDIQLDKTSNPQVQSNPNNQTLMWRYGNTMLINWQTNYNLTWSSGQIIRFYLTNTANVRPFNLTISGAKIKLIGSDIWLYEKPSFVKNILIWPAERYIVDIYFPASGNYILANSTTNNGDIKLANIYISDDHILENKNNLNSFLSIQTIPLISQDINKYRPYFDKSADKNLTIDMAMDMDHSKMWNMKMWWWMMMWDMNHPNEVWNNIYMPWLVYDENKIEREDEMQMMNDMSSKENTKRKLIDDQTKKENMDIMRNFNKWDIVKIHINNKLDSSHSMQHPIHFHWQRFLIISHNGVKNTNLVRKDTVLLAAGDNVDILVDMSNPGSRMAHCHIAEHLMGGMMMHYIVNDTWWINK